MLELIFKLIAILFGGVAFLWAAFWMVQKALDDIYDRYHQKGKKDE